MKPGEYLAQLKARQPKVPPARVGPYQVLQGTDGKWIVYSEDLPFGNRTVTLKKTMAEAVEVFDVLVALYGTELRDGQAKRCALTRGEPARAAPASARASGISARKVHVLRMVWVPCHRTGRLYSARRGSLWKARTATLKPYQGTP